MYFVDVGICVSDGVLFFIELIRAHDVWTKIERNSGFVGLIGFGIGRLFENFMYLVLGYVQLDLREWIICWNVAFDLRVGGFVSGRGLRQN
jgi:hypothetical protein